MKKILLFSGLILLIIGLNAHGACLIKNLKLEQSCTGGASNLDSSIDIDSAKEKNDKSELKKEYQIPTMSVPTQYKNGFPILNQNCMPGGCLPK